MTHRDHPRGPSGKRMAAGDAAHPPSAVAAPLRRTGRQRLPTGRGGDRSGGLPRFSDGRRARLRMSRVAAPTLLEENLGKPSL